MNIENILKGKIAENLTEELLKKSCSSVLKLGSNSILDILEKEEKTFSRDSIIGRKISSIPDFVITSKNKKTFFIEVKFRSDPDSLEEGLILEKDFLEKFWKTKIILVTLKEKPYFRVITPPYFSKEKKEGWPIPILNWLAIEDDPDLNIEKENIEDFEMLAKKYYLGFKN